MTVGSASLPLRIGHSRPVHPAMTAGPMSPRGVLRSGSSFTASITAAWLSLPVGGERTGLAGPDDPPVRTARCSAVAGAPDITAWSWSAASARYGSQLRRSAPLGSAVRGFPRTAKDGPSRRASGIHGRNHAFRFAGFSGMNHGMRALLMPTDRSPRLGRGPGSGRVCGPGTRCRATRSSVLRRRHDRAAAGREKCR